jgi:hypothetical protein
VKLFFVEIENIALYGLGLEIFPALPCNDGPQFEIALYPKLHEKQSEFL